MPNWIDLKTDLLAAREHLSLLENIAAVSKTLSAAHNGSLNVGTEMVLGVTYLVVLPSLALLKVIQDVLEELVICLERWVVALRSLRLKVKPHNERMVQFTYFF